MRSNRRSPPTTCPLTPALSSKGERESETAKAPSVEEILASWPAKPQEVAKQMITKYGPPQEVTPVRLIWHYNGPWKQTIVSSQETPHNFPKPHTDVLEQTIEFRVPPGGTTKADFDIKASEPPPSKAKSRRAR